MNTFEKIAHNLFKDIGIPLPVEHHLKFISDRKEATPCIPIDFIYSEYVKYAGKKLTPISKEDYIKGLSNGSYAEMDGDWVTFDRTKLIAFVKSKSVNEEIGRLVAEKERLQNRFDNYIEEMTEVNGELMRKLKENKPLPIIEEVEDPTISDMVAEEMEKLDAKERGNSSIKGQVGENVVEEIVKDNFERVKRVTGQEHASDFIVDRVMIEVKNYGKTVPITEVVKFHKDVTGMRMIIGGLFISINTKISTKKNLFAEVIDSRPIIYLVNPTPSMIIVAIDILKNCDNAKKRSSRIEHMKDLTGDSLPFIEDMLLTLDKLLS